MSSYEKLLITDLDPNDHAKSALKTTVKYDFERDDFISAVKNKEVYILWGCNAGRSFSADDDRFSRETN